MKIILVSSSYPLHPDDAQAAAGLFVRDIGIALKNQGHQVRVLTQQRKGRLEPDPGIAVTWYPWWGTGPLADLRLTRPGHLLGMGSVVGMGVKALLELIKEKRPDLLIALWALPGGLICRLASSWTGVPYRVWTLGSDLWNHHQNPLTRRLLKSILQGAERLFGDGQDLVRLTQSISGRPCSLLHSSRSPVPSERPSPGLQPQKKNFVFIGRFHPNKGIDWLIEAIENIPDKKRREYHFYLFGEGPLMSLVSRQIQQWNLASEVSLMGYADRQQAANYLSHAHALIIPSRIDSIPVVLSDAANCGCPVVATNVGDLGPAVKKYQVGIVANPGPEGLAQAIVQMANLPREGFFESCLRLAEDFSIEHSARTLIA